MSEYTQPMYSMPAVDSNNWNNNPFAYLIWIYALRWMGFGNGELAGGRIDTLNATQIDDLRSSIGQIQADVACGNSNGQRFMTQVENELRSIGGSINGLGSQMCDAKTAVLNQLSNMQWQLSNDTASVVSAINSCCCATQNKIDNLSCAIEKEILGQTNVLQSTMNSNANNITSSIGALQLSTQQGFNNIGNGLSSLGYAISQNDCNIRQLIASEGCATRQLMRDLHTEDVIATKDATIAALQGKIYDQSQTNLANTIISALKTTSTTTPAA